MSENTPLDTAVVAAKLGLLWLDLTAAAVRIPLEMIGPRAHGGLTFTNARRREDGVWYVVVAVARPQSDDGTVSLSRLELPDKTVAVDDEHVRVSRVDEPAPTVGPDEPLVIPAMEPQGDTRELLVVVADVRDVPEGTLSPFKPYLATITYGPGYGSLEGTRAASCAFQFHPW